MLELYMIGAFHHDLNGPERLYKLLDQINPTKVSVEFDQDRVNRLNEWNKYMEDDFIRECVYKGIRIQFGEIDDKTVERIISREHYEYYVALEYVNKKEIGPLVLSDKPDKKDPFEEQEQNSREIVVEDFGQTYEEFQRKVDELYKNERKTFPPVSITDSSDLCERDEYTESILRSMDGRVAQGGGFYHMFTRTYYKKEEINLFERLSDLNPIRIKLIEADKLKNKFL